VLGTRAPSCGALSLASTSRPTRAAFLNAATVTVQYRPLGTTLWLPLASFTASRADNNGSSLSTRNVTLPVGGLSRGTQLRIGSSYGSVLGEWMVSRVVVRAVPRLLLPSVMDPVFYFPRSGPSSGDRSVPITIRLTPVPRATGDPSINLVDTPGIIYPGDVVPIGVVSWATGHSALNTTVRLDSDGGVTVTASLPAFTEGTGVTHTILSVSMFGVDVTTRGVPFIVYDPPQLLDVHPHSLAQNSSALMGFLKVAPVFLSNDSLVRVSTPDAIMSVPVTYVPKGCGVDSVLAV
jgi:hypothetical protein